MTHMTSQEIDQFLGLNDDLADAMHRWRELRDSARDDNLRDQFHWAAYRVALCIGHCRMFAVDPEGIDEFVLASEQVGPLFYCAWQEVDRITKMLSQESDEESTEGLFLANIDAMELEFTALDILQSRLHFEGLRRVLVDQRVLVVLDATVHRQRIDVFEQLLETFDEEIDNHREELAVVADTAWVTNMDAMLPADTWQPRPWWLTREATAILDDHRSLVAALLDPEVGEVCVLSIENGIDALQTLVRDEESQKTEGESLVTLSPRSETANQPSESFVLAADQSIGAALTQLAFFRGQLRVEKLSTRLFISSQYQDVPLNQVPESVSCRLSARITRASKEDSAPMETWRLRWGTAVFDFAMTRLEDELIPGIQDWQRSVDFPLSQLGQIVASDDWQQQYWRRID